MDFNRIALLLHVIKTSRDYPTLAHIHNAAMQELEKANREAAKPKQESLPLTAPELPLKGPASPSQSGEGKRVYSGGTHEAETERRV